MTDSKEEKGEKDVVNSVKVPKKNVIVANTFLHISNPQQWESSFMSFDAYQQNHLQLKDYVPEFLVLGTIPPENILSVE